MGKKTTSSEDELRSQNDFRNMAPPPSDSQEGKTLVGEVRLRVTLTNAVDEALVRRGLLSADRIRHYEADALVDTGAVRTVLPSHVVHPDQPVIKVK